MPIDTPTTRAERRRLEDQQELAEAALDVFVERGYHRTRIADISAKVGVGQGTFYRHFDGKRAVIDYLMSQQIERVMAIVSGENAATSADTIEEYQEQVWRMVRLGFEIMRTDAKTVRLLILEAPSVDSDLVEQMEAVTQVMRTVVRGYHENGIAKGYFRSDLDLEAHTDAALALVLGGIMRAIRDFDEEALERYVAASLEMVVSSARKV